MDHQSRLDDIQHILHCIADEDTPIQYDSDPPTNNKSQAHRASSN